jgi:hypothetical protein
MNQKHFFAPTAWRLGGASLRRAAITLLLTVLTTATAWAQYTEPVSYIDADGILCDGQDGRLDPANAIALDGTETEIGQYGEETWYFVGADISYSGTINFYSNVNIILADGKTMTVNNNNGIYGVGGPNDILTIYGQTLGTGTLDITATNKGINYGTVVIRGGNVNATGTNNAGISAYGDVTITGGQVTATSEYSDGIYAVGSVTITGGTVNATGTNSAGINADGNVTITGGQVTATGNNAGIYADRDVTITGGTVTATSNSDGIFAGGDITLGWTNATDFIKASSYFPGEGKTVNIAGNQTLYDEDGNEYSSDRVYYYLAGKTLRPYDCNLSLSDAASNSAAIATANGLVYNVTLSGRTLYKDGAWNTLCLPFALGDDQAESGHELDGTPLEGATLMTLGNSPACNTAFDPQTSTLNLEFLPAKTVEPGVAYIVKWPIPDGMTADEFAAAYAANPDAYDLKNPVFTGVTVTNDAPADHATTSQDGYVTFVGTYGPAAIYAEPATALYLGAANKLYWPSTEGYRLGAFRAYFQLGNDLTCGDPSNQNAARAITLNFGDASEQTGIISISKESWNQGNNPEFLNSLDYYTLDGRRLVAQPSKKGLYIHGGKKVVIK